MLVREPVSFWREKKGSRRHSTMCFRENIVVAETNVKCKKFNYAAIARGLTFLVIKKYSEAFWGVYFLKIGENIVSQISYLYSSAVILVLESRVLCDLASLQSYENITCNNNRVEPRDTF